MNHLIELARERIESSIHDRARTNTFTQGERSKLKQAAKKGEEYGRYYNPVASSFRERAKRALAGAKSGWKGRKHTRKQVKDELRDPRLYSNLRGRLSGEDLDEILAAHKKLSKGKRSVGSAMKEGFTRRETKFSVGSAMKERETKLKNAAGAAAGGLAGNYLARDKAGLSTKDAREAMRKKFGDNWSNKTGGKPVVNPNTQAPYKTGAKAGKLKGGVRGAGVDKHYKKLKAGRKGMMGYGMLAGAAMGGIASHYSRKNNEPTKYVRYIPNRRSQYPLRGTR